MSSQAVNFYFSVLAPGGGGEEDVLTYIVFEVLGPSIGYRF